MRSGSLTVSGVRFTRGNGRPNDGLPGPFSFAHAANTALMPLGGLLGGVLISGLGMSPALLVLGVAYFAATMAPAVLPSFREMDRRPAPVPEPVPEPDSASEPAAVS